MSWHWDPKTGAPCACIGVWPDHDARPTGDIAKPDRWPTYPTDVDQLVAAMEQRAKAAGLTFTSWVHREYLARLPWWRRPFARLAHRVRRWWYR